jgi:hypothetical protein
MGRAPEGAVTAQAPIDRNAEAAHEASPPGVPRDPDTWIDRIGIPVVLFLLALIVYLQINDGRRASLDYFVPLANAFLHGELGIRDAPSWLNEVVPAGGDLSYVVYPPAPAIVLLPIVLVFGPDVNQAWPSIALGALNVALVSMILRAMGVERWPRVVLSLVFAFGTVVWYSAQAGTSWQFAHVVATLFMLVAIYLCQRDGPPALIGLAYIAAAMARLPVAMAAPFFVAYLLDRELRERFGDPTPFGWLGAERPRAWTTRPDVLRTLRFAWPAGLEVGIVVLAYLFYNQARFGSPFENGYAMIPGLLQEAQYAHGFFSVVNIPRIFYAMFLTTPINVADFPWFQSRQLGGLSIILTTPLFLWSIKARRPDWFGLGCWASVLLILIPILSHADPGGAQFGFRYAQDLYPFLLLLTVRGLGGWISTEAAIAIGIGFIVNLWGMASTYYDWWA